MERVNVTGIVSGRIRRSSALRARSVSKDGMKRQRHLRDRLLTAQVMSTFAVVNPK